MAKFPKLKGVDWMVIVAALLFWAVHLTTQFIIAYETELVGEAKAAQALIQAQELNPLLDAAVASAKLNIFISLFYIPALVFGLYWIVRRKFINTPNEWVVDALASVFVWVAVMNLTNDLVFLLGLIAK